MIHAIALFHFILIFIRLCFLCNKHSFYCYQDTSITKNDDFKFFLRNNSAHYRSVIIWFVQQGYKTIKTRVLHSTNRIVYMLK